jgi:hypothetical protein
LQQPESEALDRMTDLLRGRWRQDPTHWTEPNDVETPQGTAATDC